MVTSLSSKTTSNTDINAPNKCKAALSVQILSQTDATCSVNRCMVQKLSHKLAPHPFSSCCDTCIAKTPHSHIMQKHFATVKYRSYIDQTSKTIVLYINEFIHLLKVIRTTMHKQSNQLPSFCKASSETVHIDWSLKTNAVQKAGKIQSL